MQWITKNVVINFACIAEQLILWIKKEIEDKIEKLILKK
ncbi:hypothetical protein FH5_05171 [Priestia endophytica]|nr:hypothetical protein FH5_05171 [Priestia endophytica]